MAIEDKVTPAAESSQQVKTTAMADQVLLNKKGQPVKKGELVRLLVPIYDGVQRIDADTEVYWPHDDPPLKSTAALAGEKDTPLDAPAMTSGKPSATYIDPMTGEKPVIEST